MFAADISWGALTAVTTTIVLAVGARWLARRREARPPLEARPEPATSRVGFAARVESVSTPHRYGLVARMLADLRASHASPDPRLLKSTLERYFGPQDTSMGYDGYERIESLTRVGLVTVTLTDAAEPGLVELWEKWRGEAEAKGRHFPDATQLSIFNDAAELKLTPHFFELRQALGFSLTNIMKADTPGALFVRPAFPTARLDRSTDVAVIMPFADRFRPSFDGAIVPACEAVGLTCARCDSGALSQQIIGEIFAMIGAARIVIADLSALNPNVLYELGIAHTLGKPSIIIIDEKTSPPFDLSHVRHLRYRRDPRGLRDLASSLKTALAEAQASRD